jgi:hypothetical protein
MLKFNGLGVLGPPLLVSVEISRLLRRRVSCPGIVGMHSSSSISSLRIVKVVMDVLQDVAVFSAYMSPKIV